MAFKTFYSKLLLFGEYAIIHGSEALAIPLHQYHLRFTFNKDEHSATESVQFLHSFYQYVSKHCLPTEYNITQFKNDLNHGLHVSSQIPIGYGLGSSGALVAAFFDAYCICKEKFENIIALKNELGRLESLFHGSSSGLDPLVSYLNKGVWIKNGNEHIVVEVVPSRSKEMSLFLYNSGIERRTAPLVSMYLEHMKDSTFEKEVKESLFLYNAQIIDAYLSGDVDRFTNIFKKISDFHIQYFSEMIPPQISTLMKSNSYWLKICGAGGGGFFLGMGESKSLDRVILL